MWLERFSGQSTPTNRTESPAPRRSIQLGPSTLPRRPGVSPRSSSLSIASLGGSTDSLPATTKPPNVASLKSELSSSLAADVAGPLDVLANIVGSNGGGATSTEMHTAARASEKPPVLADDIDFGDHGLEEYIHSAKTSNNSSYTNGTDLPNVDDYEKEKDKFEDLHKSILACDEVLRSVETYLTSFQADLAAVSAEIETLQKRSSSLNTKLDNRKIVEKVLSPEVESLVVPPQVVRKLAEGSVDETWTRALDELERRSIAMDGKLKQSQDVKAVQDVKPFIEDVATKAIERIRDYVVSQIKAIRSPSINAQMIQQNNFLRNKNVFTFLAKRQPQLAEEITQAYVNTMRWYYLHNFTRYKVALEKLNVPVIDQTATIAAELTASRVAKPGTAQDAFNIGRRGVILQTSSDVALSSYLAEEDKGTHYLETPFRAFNLALVDNACAEFSFLTEFFGTQQSFHAINRHFQSIFRPTFELGHDFTKQLTEATLDALGVLISVRLNQHFAFELQRRKVPAVEGYVNGTNMLLWPRFQQLIDTHIDSIRKATASLPGKPAGSALSLTSSPSTTQTTAPHPLTQRFANFLQGILVLSSEAGDDEPVSNSLGRLRTAYEEFLVKMSKGIGEVRKRERFLYNNYSLVSTIIADTEGKLADEQKARFEELRDALNVD